MLGILGGMGSHAGVYFQDKLLAIAESNGAVRDRDYPKFCYLNAPDAPNRTNRILFEKKLRKYDKEPESPFPALLEGIKKLKAIGCEYIIIPCNTAHYWCKQLEKQSGVKILDLIENTKKEISRNLATKKPAGKYLLLATEGTYEIGLYNNVAPAGKLVIPEKHEQKLLMEAIYGAPFMGRYYKEYKCIGVKIPLKSGYSSKNFKKNDRLNPQKIILDIIDRYSSQHKLAGIIAGCTEIPLCIDNALIKNQFKIDMIDPAESTLKLAYELLAGN